MCLTALAAVGKSQQLDALDTIIANNWQLQVQVTIDRAVYFPSEAAVISLTVTNGNAR
jgi:hypothetical protein